MISLKDRLGDKEEVRLGDIAKFYKGKDISKSDINDYGEVFCIRYGELYTKYNEIIESVSSKTNTKKNLFFSEKEDVIIPSSGETAIDIATASCVNIEGIALGGDINVIRPDLEKVKGLYLAYYLNNKRKIDIAKMVQGISVMHIYNDSLKLLKLNIPNIEEQVKVMNFLSSIDILIEKQVEYIGNLKKHKKNRIYKILNSNNLKIMKLSHILSERNQLVIKGSLEHVSLTKEGVVPKSERYFRDNLVKDDTTKKYKVTKINDIVYNPANLKFGVIGRNKYKDAIFSPIYVTYEVNPICNSAYVEMILTTNNFISYIRKYEQGTVYERMGVSSSDFLLGQIKVHSLEEQNKIASLLSSMDKLIELNEKKLEQLKLKKKYYLNEIFR